MWYRPFGRRLDDIEVTLRKMQETIMASLDDVKASQAAEDTDIAALLAAAKAGADALAAASAQIAALQAQIAAGSPASAADLDAIKADMDAQKASMDAALAPAAPPAPQPTP